MGTPRRPVFALVALVLFIGARPAGAGEAWPVARGPSDEPNPFRYDPKQWASVPKGFLDDATACVLYAGNNYLVDPDGTVENVTHEVTRLNGRKGIEKLGEYRQIAYDPSYQKLVLNVAVLHKADGRRLEVEPRHVQLRDISTDFQVYDHEKQLIISFPDLEVGDTLEVKWTVRGKNPEHAGHFFTRYEFGDPDRPVVLDELRVRLPASMPFRHACVGGRVEFSAGEEGGRRLYDWKLRNADQLPRDENLPSREELRPSVVCSTFASWDEVGRWKAALRDDAWAATPEVRAVVREATRGLTDPTAKARALTSWLRRNIRYVSSGERHDYTPHPPARVLGNRYGDCKDTSQLLAVMFREAGLNVALATLGTLDDGQVVESVPSPWGTHAILLVTLPDGEHWVDTTLSLGGWDFLPREDRDRLCYVVDAAGRASLRRTPPLTADDNRFELATELWVGLDGTSRCQRTVVARGAAALTQRDNFVEAPAGERRRQVASDLQEANSRARLLRLTFDENALKDLDRPVTAQMVFEIPGHFAGSPDREGCVSDNRTWTRLLAYNLDYDRQVALELPTPFESVHRYSVHLPAGYALEGVPREQTVTSPWGRFEVRVKAPQGGGSVRDVELTFRTRLEKTRVVPAQFDEYRRFHEDVLKAYRVWLTLRPASTPADAAVLEGVLAFAPEDTANAAALARLYHRTGNDGEARRVVRRSRRYRPDDAALCELAVLCAADADEEEAAQRELVRLEPDEPSRQLTLGAMLVRRGKHAAAQEVLAAVALDAPPAERAQALFQLALSCSATGKAAEALRHLDAAAVADPGAAKTLRTVLLRGRVCEDLRRPADAASAYRQALALDANSDDALNGLVRIALATDNRAEALDFLRRYAVAAGDDADRVLLAADYYTRLGRLDDALDLAEKAQRLRPDARAARSLGLIHLRRGEYSLALSRLEKAGADAVVLEALLRAMLAVGAVDGLSARLDQALGIAGAPAELLRTCADAQAVLGRRKQLAKVAPPPRGREVEWARALDCLACAEQARRRGTGRDAVEALLTGAFPPGADAPGPAFALRGRLELEAGKFARAVADAARAVALSPEDGAGYYVRGRVRLERAEAGAVDDLEKAAALTQRRDADVLHALADALYRAGGVERALSVQREALRLRPGDREIADQLAAFEKAARPAGAGG